jgi:hypothetical protein
MSSAASNHSNGTKVETPSPTTDVPAAQLAFRGQIRVRFPLDACTHFSPIPHNNHHEIRRLK